MSKQKEFQKAIKEQLQKLDTKKKMILELSRLSYYKSEIINKLWHVENQKGVSKKNQPTSVKNSKPLEAE